MKPIGVIILNWNGAALLRRYLPTVIAGNSNEIADVIVVDNGSSDNSREVLEKEFPKVKTIYFDNNYGYAEGYNRAVKMLGYKYSLLLNSDVAVPEGWLMPLYDYMENHNNVVACQPKILSDSDRSRFEYAGASGGFIDSHGYPFCRGRLFDTVEEDKGQYDDVTDIFWATGAALLVRSANYIAVGGLDKDFFAHLEESDLCWRLHQNGDAIRVVPQSVVYHLGGGSLPASNPRKTYLNFRNNLFLLYKNLPPRQGRKMLFVRRLYDTLAFFMFVAKADFANARAILKAHSDFRRQRHRYDNVRPSVSIFDTFPCTRRNIIIDYNLRRRRRFSDLSL